VLFLDPSKFQTKLARVAFGHDIESDGPGIHMHVGLNDMFKLNRRTALAYHYQYHRYEVHKQIKLISKRQIKFTCKRTSMNCSIYGHGPIGGGRRLILVSTSQHLGKIPFTRKTTWQAKTQQDKLHARIWDEETYLGGTTNPELDTDRMSKLRSTLVCMFISRHAYIYS
jgi:hypothetical protein